MKLKTHAFVAKQYAKKHYANAVESVKTLKSKITKTHKIAASTAVAGGVIGAYAGSKRTKNKITSQAGVGMGSAYVLGKQSKVKGAYQLDIAPKFRAVAESKSKINKITTHKSDKDFLKAIKTKNFKSAVLSKRKQKQG
jgi:hypothetical protein